MRFARLPAILLLAMLLLWGVCAAFQSDELPEDDDEWGLVGGGEAEGVKRSEKADVGAGGVAGSVRSGAGGIGGFSRGSVTASADKKVQFTLEHSFGGSEFSPGGVFTVRVRESLKGGQTLLKFRLSRNSFTSEEKRAFQVLLENDELYTIRVPANVLNPGTVFAISSVKARCLASSNFQDRFDFHVDQGHIIGVTYGSTISCSYPRALKIPVQWSFDSLIVVKNSEQAIRSLTNIDVFEATGDMVAEDGTLVKKLPEKSFWAKYWLYIIPIGLIVLNAISQVANLPEEGAPGQGPPGGAPRVAAGSSGPRRR